MQPQCCVVQAQTVANFFLAFDQNLAIVPVLNKLDMSSADPSKVSEELQQVIMTNLSLLPSEGASSNAAAGMI